MNARRIGLLAVISLTGLAAVAAHAATATVDPANTVPERDESNNRCAVSVRMPR